MKNTLPESTKSLFWDTSIDKLDFQLHRSYVIERVLEFGDIEDLNWLKNQYKEAEIKEVIKSSKKLSIKTANFFSTIYNIPREKVLCIQKPYTQKQLRF